MSLIHRLVITLALLCFLSGCLSSFVADNRKNLGKLEYGMTKSQVHEVMGQDTVHGWSNPHRTAMQMGPDEIPIEVFYYWTDGRMGRWNKRVSDDQLTPVVFKGGKLVGWGREFWTDYSHKIDLTVHSK